MNVESVDKLTKKQRLVLISSRFICKKTYQRFERILHDAPLQEIGSSMFIASKFLAVEGRRGTGNDVRFSSACSRVILWRI